MMDTQQIQMMVDALSQLGEMSLVGFCVWLGAEFLQPIIVVGLLLGTVCFAGNKLASLESAKRESEGLRRAETSFFAYVRDRKGFGSRGILVTEEVRQVKNYLIELMDKEDNS